VPNPKLQPSTSLSTLRREARKGPSLRSDLTQALDLIVVMIKTRRLQDAVATLHQLRPVVGKVCDQLDQQLEIGMQDLTEIMVLRKQNSEDKLEIAERFGATALAALMKEGMAELDRFFADEIADIDPNRG